MNDEELENELIVNNDVPETSEKDNNLENTETNASEVEEINQDETQKEILSQEDIEKQIEERANKLFEEKVEDRIIRDRASRERKQKSEMAKYKQLESVITAGLGVETLEEAIEEASNFYKNQGIEIPEYVDERNEKEQKILARADANEIISLGMKEMEAEANRISNIPHNKRSVREQELFDTLCEAIIEERQTNELKTKGISTDILEEKSFKDFKKKFTINTPISEIYEMYMLKNKTSAEVKEKPASAGSAKSEGTQPKEVFTAERINNMSPQELKKYWNNPEFRKIAGLN